MSSLRRGHANLLCIVPILVYVPPKRARSEDAKMYQFNDDHDDDHDLDGQSDKAGQGWATLDNFEKL